jgi:hypothetical protein
MNKVKNLQTFTSVLQPIEQSIILTFKDHYVRRICAQSVKVTTGEGAILLTEFWKNFKIRQAIKNIWVMARNYVAKSFALMRKRLLWLLKSSWLCCWKYRHWKESCVWRCWFPRVRECLDSPSLPLADKNLVESGQQPDDDDGEKGETATEGARAGVSKCGSR